MVSYAPRTVAPLVVAAVLVLASCRPATGPAVIIETPSGDVRVGVEVVDTPQDRARGLMWRDELGRNAGMLFVFPDEAPRSFWMKNTPLPLDIVFIGAGRRIASIAAGTKPYSTERIPSGAPAMFVLEVNAGFCERRGIEVGQRVELPEVSSQKTAPTAP